MEIYQINKLYEEYEELKNKFGTESTNQYNWIENIEFEQFCALRLLK